MFKIAFVIASLAAAVLPIAAGALQEPPKKDPAKDQAPQDPRKLAAHFNHKKHIEDNGLKCKKCHKTDEARATMPEFKVCLNCHEEDKKANVYLKNDKPQWSAFSKQSDELKFAHKTHIAAKLTCDDCHAGMKENEIVDATSVQKIAMATCQECHEKNDKKGECKQCHKSMSEKTKPKSHGDRSKWIKGHGPTSTAELAESSGRTENKCVLCHTIDNCTTCHKKTKPKSHKTKDWKTCRVNPKGPPTQGGHCKECHIPFEDLKGSCKACHNEAAHSKAPGPPGCGGCHGTPSGHRQGAKDCKRCHTPQGVTVGMHQAILTHPDPGGECTDCHKN